MSVQQFDAGIIVPTNPEDRKKIKAILDEIVECKQKIAFQQILIKEQIDLIVEDYKIPKKMATKLANTFYKESLDAERATNETLVELYEAVVGKVD
jgi:hypothetical protein